MTTDHPVPGPIGRFAEHGPARSESEPPEPLPHWSEAGSAEELAEALDRIADEIDRKIGWHGESAQIASAAEALRELGESKSDDAARFSEKLVAEFRLALDQIDRMEREGERPIREAFIVGWLLGHIEDRPVRDALVERLDRKP